MFRKFLNTRRIGITIAPGKKDVLIRRKLLRVGKDSGFIRAAGIDSGIIEKFQPDIASVSAEGLYIGGSVFPFEKNKVSVDVGQCFSPGMEYMPLFCRNKRQAFHALFHNIMTRKRYPRRRKAARRARLRERGLSIHQVLADNDAYHALQKVGGLVITGGTGTNVNDVSVALLKR